MKVSKMRRNEFEIKNKEIIDEILNSSEYATLALACDNKPYSVPVNFVHDGNVVYFHGAKKGKKKEFIVSNSYAAFSIALPYSLIQSYFSSTDDLACPATQFFRSVCASGQVFIVEDYDEKVRALSLLMKKLQPEGKYKPLNQEVYTKMINATEVFRFDIENITGKLKVGQNLSQDRFNMVLDYLEKRAYNIDKETILSMKENR